MKLVCDCCGREADIKNFCEMQIKPYVDADLMRLDVCIDCVKRLIFVRGIELEASEEND